MDGDVGMGPDEGLVSGWRAVALALLGLVGTLVIAALIWTQADANRERDHALALQRHSYEVMILARSLASTAAGAEATLGRYVISGDRHLGQLYSEQWRIAGGQLDQLDRLIGAKTLQQRRIDVLRSAFQVRGEELSVIARSTAFGRNDQALGRYYQARRSPALDRIAMLLTDVGVAERDLLGRRTARAKELVAHSGAVTGILATVGFLLLLAGIGLGVLTAQAQSDRALARADAADAAARAAELQTAVARATDELRVQEAKLRQAQKMDAVGQLTGGIAHDFNNMLAVVLGGLELARRHAADAQTRRHIEAATEGAERAAALTRRLLAFSREETLRPEPLEPGRVLAGMRELLDPTLGDGITVELADAGRGWTVLADRVALENAVLNLAVNARDAMAGRGRLVVTTRAVTLAAGEVGGCGGGEYLALAVTDTGAGMPAHVLERAFEPFFTTKPVGRGTGLGLSQVFALVRQLGGEVAIRSAPGAGTTVTLFLPRHAASAPAVPIAFSLPTAVVAPASLDVLVVEDDPRVLAATVAALEELGHRPRACADPLDAPALIEGAPVDLVLSDVLMPGQTGPEMVASLMRRHPGLAVLFVTGFAGDAHTADFAGHPVLRKPFTLAALERGIDEATARVAPAEPIAA